MSNSRRCNLQEFLELALEVLHVALRLHHVVLVLRALGSELGEVGLAHLADAHHLLAALFVLSARGTALLVYPDGFGRIEYLHIELGYLFLQLQCLRG